MAPHSAPSSGEPSVYVYATTHEHSLMVCSAFAHGAEAPIVHAMPKPGEPVLRGKTAAAAIYGRLRGCKEVMEAAIEARRTWYYIDRGYFKASIGSDYSGYFRVTRDALQHSGVGTPNFDRYFRLRLKVHATREGGRHILILPPTRIFAEHHGFQADAWTAKVQSSLRPFTDRPVIIREKPLRKGAAGSDLPDIRTHLRDAWAVITHSSNGAVEALMQGVPVFCTGPCPALALGLADLSKIESPRLPSIDEREHWAAVLAANQWTLDEMRDGTCWKEIPRA